MVDPNTTNIPNTFSPEALSAAVCERCPYEKKQM